MVDFGETARAKGAPLEAGEPVTVVPDEYEETDSLRAVQAPAAAPVPVTVLPDEPVTVLPDGYEEPQGEDEAASDSLLGQTLGGRYRITSFIGAGGMGSVYCAEHIQLQKTVALKVLNAQMAAHREAALRFEREAMVSARIQHPHVVSATDSGRLPDGSLYLVLEYVAGRTLRELIDAEKRLPLPRALAIGAQIADALGAAHRAEIVHRDLKPGNVMLLNHDGNPEFVKVLDFGLARVVGEASGGEPLTRTGSVFGTPEYMAPEQARGEAVDHRADLYALGVILYELIGGRQPFQAPELVAILVKHVQEPPPPLPADIPAPIAEYVLALLEKSPDRRPGDARQVAKALRRLAPATTSLSTAPPRSDVAPSRSDVASSRGGGDLVPAAPARSAGALGLAAWRALASGSGRVLAELGVQLRERFLPWLGTTLSTLSALAVVLVRRGVVLLSGRSRIFWRNAGVGLALFLAPILLWALWPDPVSEDVRDRARQGEVAAMTAIAQVPERKRSAQTQLALALGYLQSGKLADGLEALERALDDDSDLADQPEVIAGVRRAVEDAETRERALELAATGLGRAGVDLLFDVWASTPEKTAATRGARRWLDTDSVRERASPALLVALQIREVKGCEAALELLPRVIDVADDRSLLPLKRFQSTSGCGFLGFEDCYPCLRKDDALERAVAEVGERPAPKF